MCFSYMHLYVLRLFIFMANFTSKACDSLIKLNNRVELGIGCFWNLFLGAAIVTTQSMFVQLLIISAS